MALPAIRALTFSGTLPLHITLYPLSARTYDQTLPFLIQFPRLSYLPFLLPQLHAFFRTSLIDPDATPPHTGWFAAEGVPLKWQLPVGLLYDLFSGNVGKGREEGGDGTDGAEGGRPWKLEVRFGDWPDDRLVRLDEAGLVLRDAFVNAVKEVRYISTPPPTSPDPTCLRPFQAHGQDGERGA